MFGTQDQQKQRTSLRSESMDVTKSRLEYKEGNTLNALDELLSICKKFDFDSTTIILGHPSDLLKMDMSKFSAYWYFISNHNLKQGELLLVKDNELKEGLYKFAKENPDRVFRGKQGLVDKED